MTALWSPTVLADEHGDGGGKADEQEADEWPEFIAEDHEPDPYEFEGDGSEVREDVEIEDGLTVVQATYDHSGISNFIVELVPEEGNFDQLFQNELEPYEGARAAVLDGGTYLLDVTADGPWTVDIYQPRAEEGEFLPREFEGESDRVYGPFAFEESHVATGSHAGERNYIVEVLPMKLDAFGGVTELVFNEIGTVETAETAFRFDGIGWIGVQADGEWELAME